MRKKEKVVSIRPDLPVPDESSHVDALLANVTGLGHAGVIVLFLDQEGNIEPYYQLPPDTPETYMKPCLNQMLTTALHTLNHNEWWEEED